MLHVELEEAKSKWSAILESALQGEEVLITRNLEPLLRLIRIRQESGTYRQPGSARGLIQMREDFDEPLVDCQEYVS
jgi:antitoxin (DNA-binding transcriptional repressor) of toxin-antitoxin stability system